MDIVIGCFYKLSFELIPGKLLTFTGEVKSLDDGFITFLDKFGMIQNFKKDKLVNFNEEFKPHNWDEIIKKEDQNVRRSI